MLKWSNQAFTGHTSLLNIVLSILKKINLIFILCFCSKVLIYSLFQFFAAKKVKAATH